MWLDQRTFWSIVRAHIVTTPIDPPISSFGADLGRAARALTPADTQRLRQLGLDVDLRYALERGQITLQYQPQFNLRENRIVGFEALMRWQHPRSGFISPDIFIPLAEESGCINALGAYALNQSCAALQEWNALAATPLQMSVNISGRQIKDGSLINDVKAALAANSLAPELLEIEITESFAIDFNKQSALAINAVSSMGVQLALDDFGIGFASMNYVRQLPHATVKIDRSFLPKTAANEADHAYFRAIVSLCKSLNRRIVIEGVETAAQLQLVRDLDCDAIQGYLLSPAMDSDEVNRHIADNFSTLLARIRPAI